MSGLYTCTRVFVGVGAIEARSTETIITFPCSDQAEAQSRALDNVGRSYCVLGEFQMATD